MAPLSLAPLRAAAKAPPSLPPQRWASSATIRSKAGMLRSERAPAVRGEDWYVENTTRSPIPFRNAAMADTSLVTGNDKSEAEIMASSSSCPPCRLVRANTQDFETFSRGGSPIVYDL